MINAWQHDLGGRCRSAGRRRGRADWLAKRLSMGCPGERPGRPVLHACTRHAERSRVATERLGERREAESIWSGDGVTDGERRHEHARSTTRCKVEVDALVTVRTCGDCMAVWQWQGRDKPCRLCVSCVNVCVCVWNPGGVPVCSVPSHVVPCGDARCGVSPWHIFPGICKTVSSMLNMNRKKHRSFSFDDFVFCDPTGHRTPARGAAADPAGAAQ